MRINWISPIYHNSSSFRNKHSQNYYIHQKPSMGKQNNWMFKTYQNPAKKYSSQFIKTNWMFKSLSQKLNYPCYLNLPHSLLLGIFLDVLKHIWDLELRFSFGLGWSCTLYIWWGFFWRSKRSLHFVQNFSSLLAKQSCISSALVYLKKVVIIGWRKVS